MSWMLDAHEPKKTTYTYRVAFETSAMWSWLHSKKEFNDWVKFRRMDGYRVEVKHQTGIYGNTHTWTATAYKRGKR